MVHRDDIEIIVTEDVSIGEGSEEIEAPDIPDTKPSAGEIPRPTAYISDEAFDAVSERASTVPPPSDRGRKRSTSLRIPLLIKLNEIHHLNLPEVDVDDDLIAVLYRIFEADPETTTHATVRDALAECLQALKKPAANGTPLNAVLRQAVAALRESGYDTAAHKLNTCVTKLLSAPPRGRKSRPRKK